MKCWQKIILFSFMLLMLPLYGVKASCSPSDVTRLRSLANNINFSYLFNEEANAKFDVTINNLPKELYLLEITTGIKYSYSAKVPELVITGVDSGKTFNFEVYAVDRNCYYDKLLAKTVTLPAYNPYYKDELCAKAKSHTLCDRWSKVNLSYEEFQKKLNDYLKEDNEEPELIPVKENIFLQFFLRYYWLAYGLIIVVGTTVITIHYKKSKLF